MINSSRISNGKKLSKSLPPVKQIPGAYIQKSLLFVKDGCRTSNGLQIDGDYGDYRMKLFRLKDRKKYYNSIQSVFTHSFTHSILQKEKDKHISQTIQKIINAPINEYSALKKQENQEAIQHNKKGNIQDILEDGGHLYYSYLPHHQKEKWFKILDRSVQKEERPPKQQPIQNKSVVVRKRRPQKQFFFKCQQIMDLSKTVDHR